MMMDECEWGSSQWGVTLPPILHNQTDGIGFGWNGQNANKIAPSN
jgi:hypothetical protein